MAPTARTPDSLTEYSRRERKALVLLSLAFVVLSALAHFLLGGALTPWFKLHPIHADTQTPQPIIVERFPRPTQAPTPRPTPTPVPVHVRQSPQPLASSNPRATSAPFHPSPPHVGNGTPEPGASPVSSPGDQQATSAPATARPSQDFAPCRMLHRVVPDYSDSLRGEGVQGTVAIIVAIGSDGQVLSVRVGETSGNALLDNAALNAARASTYACPPADGRPAADLYQVIYTFQLDSN